MRVFREVVLATTLFVIGCETGVNESEPLDYSIDQKLVCYCPQSSRWVRLFVGADTIVRVTDICSGADLAASRKDVLQIY
jgi:hypothetical protein